MYTARTVESRPSTNRLVCFVSSMRPNRTKFPRKASGSVDRSTVSFLSPPSRQRFVGLLHTTSLCVSYTLTQTATKIAPPLTEERIRRATLRCNSCSLVLQCGEMFSTNTCRSAASASILRSGESSHAWWPSRNSFAVVHKRAIGSSVSRRLDSGVRLSVSGMPRRVSCSNMFSASASALRS